MNSKASFIKLTVFFDAPFWVGVFERHRGHEYSVARVVFGPEPRSFHLLDLLGDYHKLHFSEPVNESVPRSLEGINPKRRQRQISKEMKQKQVGTTAQKALNLQRELHKGKKREERQARRREEQKQKFELKQLKKKEKKRGH